MTQDFTGFGLPAKLLQALQRMHFTTPTPIQAEAIPLALAGSDILGSAQTGTGKTGAFGIPVIAKLMEDETAQALIMTPTRELASQVMASIQPMINVPNIKTAVLIGGEAMPRQFRQLERHPRLIVGTPGRINDHLLRGTLKLANARFLVLDETDRMLDMGFGPQIDKIMEHMPQKRQTLMFSATLPENIIRMSRKYMHEPKRIAVGATNTAHAKIKQEVIKMGEADKYPRLLEQLEQRQGTVIIFVKTKYGTEKLADKLNKDQHAADAIHGDLHQRRRDRVIQGFRDKKYRVLVATDVAARGLDIPHIEHVINYDLPQAPEDYIHRIGRTARAGAEGSAVNFITPGDNNKWYAIDRLMNPNAAKRPERGDGDRDQRRPFKKGGWRGGKSFGSNDRRGDKPRFGKPWGDKPRHADGERAEAAPRHEKPFHDKPRHERPRHDRPHGERRAFGEGRHEAVRHEGARHERPAFDEGRRERPRHEGSRHEGSRHEGARHEGSRHEGARHEKPFHDKPRHHEGRDHGDKPRFGKSHEGRGHEGKPRFGKPGFGKGGFGGKGGKPGFGGKGGKPGFGGKPRRDNDAA